MSKDDNKNAKFWIHPDDFNRIIAYAKSAYDQFKCEIGGQMVCIEDAEGDFILKAPVILKQDIASATCDLDAEALAVHYGKMIEEYGRNVRHCWWHSHHTMAAFWSGTDNETILTCPSKDWTVSLVVNLKREYKLRIQFFKPFLHEENVELNFLSLETEDDEEIDKEVKELCSKPSYAVTRPIKSTTYVNGRPVSQQQSLLHGYTDSYGGYAYGRNDAWDDELEFNSYNQASTDKQHHNAWLNTLVDKSKMPGKEQDKFNLEVEAIVDRIHGGKEIEAKEFKLWNDFVKKQNKKLKKYNLRIGKIKNVREWEHLSFYYMPEDYLENIVEEVTPL